MTDLERIASLEQRVEKLEAAKNKAALILYRIAELIKGIGTKLTELTDLFKN